MSARKLMIVATTLFMVACVPSGIAAAAEPTPVVTQSKSGAVGQVTAGGSVHWDLQFRNDTVPQPVSVTDLDAGLVRYNLSLAKTRLSPTAYVGQTVVYTLTPRNDGPSAALAGWSVTDLLPAGTRLVDVTRTGYTVTESATSVTWTSDAPLAAGATGPEITLTLAVTEQPASQTLKNVAYISPAPQDGPETNPLEVPTRDTDTRATPTDNDDQDEITVGSLVSIGDYAFIDENANGLQDPGEPPLVGATISLLDAAGTKIGTTTTDENGFYSFTDLTPSTEYILEAELDPAAWAATVPNQGTDDSIDSDIDADFRVRFTTPSTGTNSATNPDDPTIDIGVVPVGGAGRPGPGPMLLSALRPTAAASASVTGGVGVSGVVWIDVNRDGRRDAGEPAEAGVTVTIWTGGTQIASTQTDATGAYSFQGLLSDTTYTVRVVASGSSFTTPDVTGVTDNGPTDSLDSDVSPDGAVTFTTPPAAGASVATAEFIDVLPYNGDGRGTRLAAPLRDVVIDRSGMSSSATIYVTTADPTTIPRDASDPIVDPANPIWCVYGTAACPPGGAYTAVYVVYAGMAAGTSDTLGITATAAGAASGDVLVNDLGAGQVTGVQVGATAPITTDVVQYGAVRLSKSIVDPDPTDALGDAAMFPVRATCTMGASEIVRTVELSRDGSAVTIDGLPVGATCTFVELDTDGAIGVEFAPTTDGGTDARRRGAHQHLPGTHARAARHAGATRAAGSPGHARVVGPVGRPEFDQPADADHRPRPRRPAR